MRLRVDGLTIVALALGLFMVLNVFRDAGLIGAVPVERINAAALGVVPLALQRDADTVQESVEPTPSTLAETAPASQDDNLDSDIVASPYDHYALTQGLHGLSYGHMAIDITGGKGAIIKSPINGIVSDLYIDQWGNPTLVIENDHYRILLLHGIYTVNVGDAVTLGQPVGEESNQGNTLDALGRSCRGRDCGYHTHLNIYDKRLGVNVNPLDLIGN